MKCYFPGQGLTPLFVRSANDIPLMNLVWFLPAVIGCIVTAMKVYTFSYLSPMYHLRFMHCFDYRYSYSFQVKSSRPPTPPSPSSHMQSCSVSKISWLASIKKLFTNPSFVLLFLYYGGCIGYTTAISTKIEQILCAYGYDNEISGLAGKSISRMELFSVKIGSTTI